MRRAGPQKSPLSPVWCLPYHLSLIHICIAIGYTMWYAHRVKKDPTKSLMYGEKMELASSTDRDKLQATYATGRQKACGVLFVLTIAGLLVGCLLYTSLFHFTLPFVVICRPQVPRRLSTATFPFSLSWQRP